MKMITRRAPDLEEVIAYNEAVESVGGRMVSITAEGQEKYETALQPHTTYRIWGMIPEDKFDDVDNLFKKAMGCAEDEE